MINKIINGISFYVVTLLFLCFVIGCESLQGLQLKHTEASLPQASASVPLPSDLRIVQPSTGVSKELGVFSGKWTGVWDGILNHILVVEEINPPHAIAVYAYGAAREWGIDRPNWSRVRGEFIDGTTLKLSLPRPATVIYRMRQDGTLDATYEYARGTSRAKMTRMKE